jgi:DNA-binding CsgD family transcriptional regulator/tetratricopeptide (TPR) repeat protein
MTGQPPSSDAPSDETGRDPRPLHARSVHVRPIRLARLPSAPIEAPFVGREQLLEHLHELADVARGGDGIVATLSGEAGIGKTRLLHEVARRGPGFGFQVDWIRDAPRAEEVLTGLAEGGPASADVSRSGDRLPFPMLKWSRKPRLFVIDDALQAECLPALAALATAGIARLPVLVLLGLSPDLDRPTIAARQALAALARQRVLAQIPVPPLGEAELSELATHLLGGRPDPRLQGAISSLTEGNPLLAEALMADLLERGQVSRSDSGCGLLGEIPATYTPPAVGTMLGHMLELIDAEIVQALASAAALGPGFQFAALQQATGQPADQLLEHLEAGLSFGILRETTEPPDDFQFVHELMRRALQGGLSRVRERRIKQALSTVSGESQRGEDADALGATLRLLERAERLCSWEEAIRQCRSALDLTRQHESTDSVDEIQLLDRLAALYFGRVQSFAAGSCLREALQVCEQLDEPLRRVVLTARLAALGPSWCSVEAAEALFEQVVRAAPDLTAFDRAALFDAHLELGFAYQRYGTLTAALPYVQTACDVVDPTDRARHSLGQYALGALLVTLGDVSQACVLLRAAIMSLDFGMAEEWSRDDLVHWRDPRRTRCMALAELARALDLLGRTDEAERYAEAARAEEVRFGILGGRSHRAKAQVKLRRGEPEAALQELLTTSDEATPGSLGMRRAADLVFVSTSHLALGNIDLALETALEGVSICSRMGAGEFLAGLQVARARALLALGRLDEAREAIVAAHRAIDELGTGVYRGEAQAVDRQITRTSNPSGPDIESGEPDAEDLASSATGNGSLAIEAPAASAAVVAPAAIEYVRGRSLTLREREILRLMATGKTNRQIAAEIGVSDKTVKRHVSNIFNKIAASTRAMAVRQALEAGILSVNSQPSGGRAPHVRNGSY